MGRIGGFRLQDHLWDLLNRRIAQLHLHTQEETEQMAALMKRYQRISVNTRRCSASIPSQIRGASPRGTFATGCYNPSPH